MSIASAPEDLALFRRQESDNILPETTRVPALSVFDWNIRNESARRRPKMTERGRIFFKETKARNRNLAFKTLKRQIDSIKELCDHPECDLELFETERNKLDTLKDKFNEAQRAYDDLVETEIEREESYRWFDIRDREYTECRLRICERIQAFDRSSYRTKSEITGSGSRGSSERSSRASSHRSSFRSLPQAKADAAAKAAKLKIEMDFLEKEKEIKRIQLEKEIALAYAEEKALEKILEEERAMTMTKYGEILTKAQHLLDQQNLEELIEREVIRTKLVKEMSGPNLSHCCHIEGLSQHRNNQTN